MGFPLFPKWIVPALTDLSPEQLKKRNIQLLMLDFDNTIVPYTTNIPTSQMEAVLKEFQDSGIQICVVSNSKRDRVPTFCKERGMECNTHAGKPFGKGICACMEKYGFAPADCALAGDQIFTDTLGANLSGVTSILVTPIHNHNIWLKLRHVAEKPFIYLAKRRLEK